MLKPMSFKKQLFIIFSSISILLISSLLTFYNILKNEKEIVKAESKRYESYLLADELRQSSDDLTRMARTYTVTGEPRFRKYFNRILDIRDGKTPRPATYSGIYWDFVTATDSYPSSQADEQSSLETRMKSMDFTRDEFHLLNEAKKQSDALVHLENQAMNAMVGLFANEEGHYVIRKKPDPLLAQKLMHSQAYHNIKKEIMGPMQEFFQRVDQRTAQTVAFYINKGRKLNHLLLFLMNLAILLVFVSFVLIFYQGQKQKKYLQKWKQADNWKRKLFFIFASWPLFALAITAFAINFSLFWWAGKNIKEQVHSHLKEELQTIVATTHNSSSQWLENTEKILESFITFSSVESLFQDKNNKKTWQSLLKKELEPFIQINKYKNYTLIDSSGNVLLSRKKEFVKTNIQKQLPKKFLSRMKETKSTALILPSDQGMSTFNQNILTGAYLKGFKEDHGFLIIEIPLAGEFSRIIQKGRFKESGESYAFNNKAYLLSESRFNDQLYKIGLIPEGKESSLSIRLLDPEVNLTLQPKTKIQWNQKKPTLMAASAFKKPRGIELKPYNDYRGVPVIGSWIWDSKYNIGFATEIDSAEAFSTLNMFKNQSHYQLFISLILLFTLTIVFIWNKALFSEVNEKLQQAYTAIKIQTGRMEEELNIGRQIQMSMVPSDFPKHDHFSLYAQLQPVRELGGDFYDFFLLDKNKLCFFIGDISGKGVPSALFMAVTKTLIRSSVFKQKPTDKILLEVNNNITLNNPYCMFATIFIAVLDLTTGECQYTSAGHHSSYLKKDKGELLVLNQTHGPVAGAVEEAKFSKTKLSLQKGDILMAYTDGITEATDDKNNLYGEERLENLLKKESFPSAQSLVDKILKDVTDFSKQSKQTDDISLIALKYLG